MSDSDTSKTEYPTKEAWDMFTGYLADIRSICETYLPQASMQIPNTRVTHHVGDRVVETDERESRPLRVAYSIADFDAAVLTKDTDKLFRIMSDAWIRLPEDRNIYRVPGVMELCNFLDFTYTGFVNEEGPEAEDGENTLSSNLA